MRGPVHRLFGARERKRRSLCSRARRHGEDMDAEAASVDGAGRGGGVGGEIVVAQHDEVRAMYV